MDIIEEISKLYRNEREQMETTYDKIDLLERKIMDKNKISARDYLDTLEEIELLERELSYKKSYTDGVSDVREMVMSLILNKGG